MRRLTLALIAIVAVLVLTELSHACSSIGSSVSVETFTCAPCEEDPKQQEALLPIFVLKGQLQINNRRAAPTLGSIVVEVLKKIDRRYTPIARRVINRNGDPMVHTCEGSFSDLPLAGSIVLTDAVGQTMGFTDVENLPEGRAFLRYIATFPGVNQLELGERIRIRVYTTAYNVHGGRRCEVDADGDGFDDQNVRTLRYQRTIRVPATATVITPPTT